MKVRGRMVPCAPLGFDEYCIREVFRNHTTRHVPPAQASPEQIVLRAEVIHPPLAFGRPPIVSFLHRADCRLPRVGCAGQIAIAASGCDGSQTVTICTSHRYRLSIVPGLSSGTSVIVTANERVPARTKSSPPCMVVIRRLIATVSLTKRRRGRAMFASALTRPQRSMHLE
jgi:hypothetical protein